MTERDHENHQTTQKPRHRQHSPDEFSFWIAHKLPRKSPSGKRCMTALAPWARSSRLAGECFRLIGCETSSPTRPGSILAARQPAGIGSRAAGSWPTCLKHPTASVGDAPDNPIVAVSRAVLHFQRQRLLVADDGQFELAVDDVDRLQEFLHVVHARPFTRWMKSPLRKPVANAVECGGTSAASTPPASAATPRAENS